MLKIYPATWQGQLILACRKCQKKLHGNSALHEISKLKKTARRLNKQHPEQQLHVINVPCMDLCPKGGVAVCCPARGLASLVILRGVDELQELSSAL